MSNIDAREISDAISSADSVSLEDQSQYLAQHLASIEAKLSQTPVASQERAQLSLDKARTLVALGQPDDVWQFARPAVDVFIAGQDWENAADACDVLYNADQEGSISALGQGIWLAVTYPIDVNLTLALLQHLVDETPNNADGAAVAAAAAAYLVEMRASEAQMKSLSFFANQLLGSVAQRHSQVASQAAFEIWIAKLELQDPAKFFPRLRNVVDVLVQEDWWFDRDKLRAGLPEE